ncbi:MAG: outer membrane protein OmpA-like peptidoglycan-associated protein [Saprospiraceae bacterium]|jgi:outer membrane protein OmpA-like peptidoglycan-associated protein/tetratricopeptide (TPR) repeat protein
MKHFFILLFLFFSTFLLAQPGFIPSQRVSDLVQSGEQYLLGREYKKALKSFEKALDAAPKFIAALRGKGVCYQLLGQYSEAVIAYGAILEIDPYYSRTMYYEYGEVLFKSGNYSKALKYFLEFKKIVPTPEEEFQYRSSKERGIEEEYARKLPDYIRACEVAMDSVRYQNIRQISNLGDKINTPADEYFPFLTNDQRYLFYTTREDQFADENLFLTEKKEDAFERGSSVSSAINSDGNEGMSSIVRDGRKIYFTACDRRQVLGTCDIWQADLRNLSLSGGEPLKGYANSGKWESQASISCDGTMLYFASNREGGMGGTDIWLSRQLPDGRWGKPENLGPKINTELDEEAPFITNDGSALYFSSNGHPGLGEQDIFMSRMSYTGDWSLAINLGTPVNSSYREIGFFLTADGKNGYFSSDRETGLGGMDIYNFELPEQLTTYPMTFVEGIVIDSIYSLPIVTKLFFNDRLPIHTDERGRFFRCVPADDFWEFNIRQEGFRPFKSRLTIPQHDNKSNYRLLIKLLPEERLLNLSKEERDEELRSFEFTEKLYFGVDMYGIEMKHRKKLDAFLEECFDGVSIIKEVDIVGFADASGGDAYNMMLSEKRAREVAIYLQSRGIRVDRIYLGAEGAVNNDNPATENRRVELRVKLMRKE